MKSPRDRVVHKSHRHEDAHRWDVEQNASMSPVERLRAAKRLKDRVFPPGAKDVRECHRSA